MDYEMGTTEKILNFVGIVFMAVIVGAIFFSLIQG